MKVVRNTGLVPVRDNKVGRIFGVRPAAALEMVKAGKAELYPIPADVETFEIPDEDGPAPEAPKSAGPIDIPEGWERFHYTRHIQIAKSILGDAYVLPAGVTASVFSRQVIADEVQRRAAENPVDPA